MKRLIVLLAGLMFMLSGSVYAEKAQEFVLFEGEATVPAAWQLITGVNTTNAHGEFDPYLITDGCYFVVEYTGTQSAVYFALSEWTAGTWSQVDSPADCKEENGVFKAVFTYEQCVTAYGNDDFAEVDQICVGSANATDATTLLRITWHGKAPRDDSDSGAVLFRGAVTSYMPNSNMAFVFTKHAGGDFDASNICPGAKFRVEYAGTKGTDLYLAFSSHSGATHWARVDACEAINMSDGIWSATFDYESIVRAWGNDFARLDQISVFSATTEEVTLRMLLYCPGTGIYEGKNNPRWDRPDTGIAFIGDSICQNAQLLYGDWNTILGRSDCVNFGIGGQTTRELAARIDELAQRDYQRIVFICGINDIGHGLTNEDIINHFDLMINAVRAQNPECQFILVSVLPTTRAFYLGQQNKIVELNKAYEHYASETEHVTYVDVYSSFTASAGEYAYQELLSDGLHPNDKGYNEIAKVLQAYLQ